MKKDFKEIREELILLGKKEVKRIEEEKERKIKEIEEFYKRKIKKKEEELLMKVKKELEIKIKKEFTEKFLEKLCELNRRKKEVIDEIKKIVADKIKNKEFDVYASIRSFFEKVKGYGKIQEIQANKEFIDVVRRVAKEMGINCTIKENDSIFGVIFILEDRTIYIFDYIDRLEEKIRKLTIKV